MKIFQFSEKQVKVYKTLSIVIVVTFLLITLIYLSYRRYRNHELGRSDKKNIEYEIDAFEGEVKGLEGLVAYYPLDEDFGNAINRAPDTFRTLDGKVNGADQGVEGLIGKAYSFDGVDDEVTIPYDSVIDITDDEISLFALIKLDSLPSSSSSQMQIIKHLRTSPVPGGYQLEVNGTDLNYPNEIRINVKGPDDNYISGHGETLETGKWYFIVATYDGSNLATYINGVNDKTDSAIGKLEANSQDLIIGGQCNSVNNFHGLLQHVGIVARCLSEEEVRDLVDILFYESR